MSREWNSETVGKTDVIISKAPTIPRTGNSGFKMDMFPNCLNAVIVAPQTRNAPFITFTGFSFKRSKEFIFLDAVCRDRSMACWKNICTTALVCGWLLYREWYFTYDVIPLQLPPQLPPHPTHTCTHSLPFNHTHTQAELLKHASPLNTCSLVPKTGFANLNPQHSETGYFKIDVPRQNAHLQRRSRQDDKWKSIPRWLGQHPYPSYLLDEFSETYLRECRRTNLEKMDVFICFG